MCLKILELRWSVKKLYLHIGPHKTGSTYLQKALYANADEIKKKGFIYPLRSTSLNIAHHDLAESYKAKNFYHVDAELQEILSSKKYNIILSSENFDRLDLESVKKMKDDLKDYSVSIVFFSREPASLLVSSWQESVKHGSMLSWREYAFDHLLRPFQSNVLNKNRVLDVYSEVFGVESINIFDYSFYEKENIDIFEEFLRFCAAWPIDRKDKNKRINSSMKYSHIELIRVLNAKFSFVHGAVHHFVRTAFLDYLKENPSCKNIEKLENIIEKDFELVSLDDSFSLNSTEKVFSDKYSNQKVVKSQIGVVESSCYKLPKSSWFFSSGAEVYIQLLFESLEERVNQYMNELNFVGKR